ncbi:MAG: hypothetical protein M1825_006011 [Sarcosagium campestre]|nr:MAG: hypothetical protein M1825_006011 [Sarcosagium campestre]
MAPPRHRQAVKDTKAPVTQSPSIAAVSTPLTNNVSGTSIYTSTSLRKGATFHSTFTPSSEPSDPILHIPSLPKRSHTCPRTLDDVVVAGERRMAALLGSIDRSISEDQPTSPRIHPVLSIEDLPLPRGMLDATVSGPSPPVQDTTNSTRDGSDVGAAPRRSDRLTRNPQNLTSTIVKHHSSDSGIGSTVSGTVRSSSENVVQDGDVNHHITSHSSQRFAHSYSAITRSLSTISGADTHQTLSPCASERIQRYILQPILRGSALKEFHPLVRDIPRRISEKEILCLRDLEKTLLFLAPVSACSSLDKLGFAYWIIVNMKSRTKSPASYLDFCETSIQCIHTTVEHLHERDQRRPTDAPYTNGYFLDLVGQVRQYASIMAASRERRASGQAENEMDYSPDERVVLQGGLSQTGRLARLVRVKEGKTIGIGNKDSESDVKEEDLPSVSLKRSHSDTSNCDSVHRSMARRPKLSPGEVVTEPAPQICRDCSKEFKRPCDLTKHEKTHSRPWKCAESSCKYHTYGWPTEKERDRHANDKHSVQPALYECLYPPCTYRSKRESNCKQHMEKTHGWEYVRAKGKGNGAKGVRETPSRTPQTPQITTPNTVDASTPMTGISSTHTGTSDFQDDGGMIGTSVTSHGFEEDPLEGMPPYFGSLSSAFSLHDFDQPLDHASTVTFTPPVDQDSLVRGSPMDANPQLGTPDAFDASHTMQGEGGDIDLDGIDWSSLNNPDVWNAQLITPEQSVEYRPHSSFGQYPDVYISDVPENLQPAQGSTLSPNGQAHLMLTSATSGEDFVGDEGFDDFVPTRGPMSDFALYASENSSTMGSANEAMFPDLAALGNRSANHRTANPGSGLSQPLPTLNDYMDLDYENE